MLVPLTASLYVPGKLDDAEKVLVDVGTGYFIEVSAASFFRFQINTDSFVLEYLFTIQINIEP